MLANLLANFVNEFADFLRQKPQEASRYVKVRSILTKNEAYFYQLLLQIGYENIVIITKVRLADIFNVDMPQYSKGWSGQFNRIAMKHVDYLVIDKSGTPLVGIELDDSTHQRADRKLSDQFKDALFQSCKIPLLRFPLHYQYTTHEIHSRLKFHVPQYARAQMESVPTPIPQPTKPIHIIAQERKTTKPPFATP